MITNIDKHIDCLVASGISVAEIAKHANVNPATIYRAWGGRGGGMRLDTAQAILSIKPWPRKSERKTK